MLQSLTIGINFIGLMAALWMGLVLVTRSSRRPEAWLSAVALWSLGGYYLNHLLAFLPPPAPPPEIRIWLYHLMLFWPRDVFEMGWKGWLLGWLPVYSIIFWYHASLYLLPGSFNGRRWLGAGLGYALALASILVKAGYSDAWLGRLAGPLYDPLPVAPFSAISAAVFVPFAGLCVFNLARAARASPTGVSLPLFRLFVSAVILAAAAGLPGIFSYLLKTPLPQALAALFLLAALLLAGVAATGYHTLRSLRDLRGDLLTSAAGAAALLALFLLILRIFSGTHPLPGDWYVLTGCLAVLSNSLVAAVRPRLVRLYKQDGGRRLHPRLSKRESLANGRAAPPGSFPGNPRPAVPGEGNHSNNAELPVTVGGIAVRDVELALRNLHHYAYLASSPLTKLRLVEQQLKGLDTAADTHIGRGKALSAVLCEALRQLKPAQEDVPNPPPRSWHPYIILWEAYVENRPNLEIMSRLYISEGTFNRTRKAAIFSVARLLEEMEGK
ncbi:MAG: hypothetical protein M1281_05830 [Chloroflexi bacterium]|nr:hypothetical protein [Chloroflexota bacterium]